MQVGDVMLFLCDGDDYDGEDALYIDDVNDIQGDADDEGEHTLYIDDADTDADADDEGDGVLHLEAPAAAARLLYHRLVMRLLCTVSS